MCLCLNECVDLLGYWLVVDLLTVVGLLAYSCC